MKKCFLVIVIFFSANIFAQDGIQTSNNQSNVLLMQPISVTIGGNFIVNGSFPASKLQRLDNLITTLFIQAEQTTLKSLNQLENINTIKQKLGNYPLRNITLKRATGQILKIDLLKFRMNGDFNNNPYLLQDDLIIFPFYDTDRNIIDISGAVNKPTKIQFSEGDKLSDAILFAGGMDKSYENISKAQISRLDKTGNNEQVIDVNINDDIILIQGDRIRIIADENQRKNYKVLVLGQVVKPGYVYITKDGDLLKDVLEKVGGMKQNADLVHARVIRNYNSFETLQKYGFEQNFMENPNLYLKPEMQLTLKQKENILEMLRTSNLTDEDTLFFNIDNELRILKANSLVDFAKIQIPESDASKFRVKDGDYILIPDKFDYVYVFGQVAEAGYVNYAENKDYKYYIEKAGGKTETARDDEDVIVIKGNGKNWITERKDKVSIESGDFIYVPKVIPRTAWNYLSRVGTIAGILGSVATIILLFKP
jgi:protein involved in polysaccharide export with SLBB domain